MKKSWQKTDEDKERADSGDVTWASPLRFISVWQVLSVTVATRLLRWNTERADATPWNVAAQRLQTRDDATRSDVIKCSKKITRGRGCWIYEEVGQIESGMTWHDLWAQTHRNVASGWTSITARKMLTITRPTDSLKPASFTSMICVTIYLKQITPPLQLNRRRNALSSLSFVNATWVTATNEPTAPP